MKGFEFFLSSFLSGCAVTGLTIGGINFTSQVDAKVAQEQAEVKVVKTPSIHELLASMPLHVRTNLDTPPKPKRKPNNDLREAGLL